MPTSELVLPVESKQSDVLVVDTAVSTPAAPPPASVSLDPAATAVDTVIVVEERLPEEESAPIVAEQVVIVEPSPPADIAVPVPTDAVVAVNALPS